MSKRDQIYTEFSDNGYPDDPEEKEEFAARLFGARMVGAMDSVLDDKMAILFEGKGDARHKELISQLETMDLPQKKAVAQLVKDSCADFFYWMLVKIRNFPDYVEVNVMQHDEETGTLNKICDVGEETELHHRYFDWIEEFSDHIEKG